MDVLATRLNRTVNMTWRFACRTALIVSVVLSANPSAAQILPQPGAQTSPYGQSVPAGSPLNSANSSLEEERNASSLRPELARDRYEPIDVSGDRSDTTNRSVNSDDDRLRTSRQDLAERNPRLKPLAPPNEFERFVERAIGRRLPRFGADLLLPSNRDYATPATATVPPGYILNVGDRIQIGMAGSIEGSVQREIDTNGRIFLARVGWIRLAGVRFGDLKDVLARAIGTKFRNFTVNAGIEQLRGVRVYVTGFANNPGAYTVNSLSTLVNAVLAAGGPSSGGSLRSVKLYRNNEQVADFDLYRMLLRGDRTGDAILQNEDVLFIPALGEQVAVSGSVNTEAIFEIASGESLDQLLAFAGGPNTVADASRLVLYRQSNYDTIGAQEIARVDATRTTAEGGDILTVLSQGTLQRSVLRQSVLVRIEGEVAQPGNYYLPANTPLAVALERAGGLTPTAFVYGTRFERASVRRQQREAFLEAIQQLEISLAAAPLTAEVTTSVDAAERERQRVGAQAVLERLRAAEPDGRVVLGLPATATALPGDFLLENNDRIVVPPRPTAVGVFGAVYRPASFALSSSDRPLRVSDYVERAGGTLRAADRGGIFLVRANGDVVSKRRGALGTRVLPGDVVFVPVRTQSNSVWAKIRDISTIFFQFGIAAATVAAID